MVYEFVSGTVKEYADKTTCYDNPDVKFRCAKKTCFKNEQGCRHYFTEKAEAYKLFVEKEEE